jgi:type IV pilus biogenesis protein CpaD/CtpE
MRTELGALAAASLILLSGCATDGTGALPYMGGKDNFGEANRQTMAAQVVDPDPVYDTAIPETHAEHAGQAVERYRTDKVKMPVRIQTSKNASGGSGGN